ncbi:uncharacterized protein DFL_006570 [Arthrobotrys flagrans]|uniref:Uncharacterized protein n=1 Tax=Arthrobotrys flagrans TaxID=97331 RepID=A0A436ZTQ5_ARTFL|nr:hypothetical protein DFL_006570 [Arthrobotrys flagrans]
MSYSKPWLSITTLPTEIQFEIFSYLTDMNSQTSIYGTCALWRRMLNRHAMLRAARYYRGRDPYTYFPVVHRFFDISPRGNGRCQVKDGAIINYQYKTDAFGYIDVSDMVKNDTIFSTTNGAGWWAPSRKGISDSTSIWSQSAVKPGNEIEINHNAAAEGQDAGGEPGTDAIWIHIQVGHDYQRDGKEPSSSAWERITLPKRSSIGDWANAFLDTIKLLLHQKGKSGAVDFDMDFREAFVSGSKPMEGWYLEIWVILLENLTDRLARLGNDIRDIERDHGVVLLALI